MELVKSVKVNLNGKDYIVGFPNVGQQMEIESLKMSLTNNNYPDMARSGLRIHQYNLDLVDGLAYFSILIPSFRKEMKLESIMDMDAFVGKSMVQAFRKQFQPWYKAFVEELHKGVFEDETKQETAA